MEKRTPTSTRQPRVCKERPKLRGNKRGLLLRGGCLPHRCLRCTVGLTSSFIAHISIQICIAVLARAALADQHPSPAPFPSPWGTGHGRCRQGCGQQRARAHTCRGRGDQPLPVLNRQPAPSGAESTSGLVRSSVPSLRATSWFLVSPLNHVSLHKVAV